ncbi:hypothetical protein [Fusobacterium sp. PH5-44]|uniref:hypothetical protein n=1 Tax=unclassified Fusobacterium TaxID=2648384 RepID=UPI003D24F772
MNNIEKTQELTDKYFDLVNHQLVPLFAKGISNALKEYSSDWEGNEITIMTDLDEHKLVFVYGDGDGVEDSEDDSVFYQFDGGELMAECTEILQELEEVRGTLHVSSEVCEWLTTALGTLDDTLSEMSITINGHYDYGLSDWDPLFES